MSERRVFCAAGEKVGVLELTHDGHARKAVEIPTIGRVGQMQVRGLVCFFLIASLCVV